LGLLSPQTAKAAQTRCSNRKRLGGQASSTSAVFSAWGRWLCPAVAQNREKGVDRASVYWRWWCEAVTMGKQSPNFSMTAVGSCSRAAQKKNGTGSVAVSQKPEVGNLPTAHFRQGRRAARCSGRPAAQELGAPVVRDTVGQTPEMPRSIPARSGAAQQILGKTPLQAAYQIRCGSRRSRKGHSALSPRHEGISELRQICGIGVIRS
jgi:hypothetical protein